MKRLILTLAAALTLGGAIAATAADAQPPGDQGRTVVRTTRTTVLHRDSHWNGDRHWNGNRGWHRGWDRGRHYGWSRGRRWGTHGRSCRTIWRHHSRTRICRSW